MERFGREFERKLSSEPPAGVHWACCVCSRQRKPARTQMGLEETPLSAASKSWWRFSSMAMLVFALLPLVLPLWLVEGASRAQWPQWPPGSSQRAMAEPIHVKVGILLEESDHELANMFIRTIKMINERRNETIRQLLNAARYEPLSSPSSPSLPAETSPSSSTDASKKSGSSGGPDLHSATSKLFRPLGSRIQLEPVIEFLSDRHSSLEADAKVCQLIESGARAILGPSDGASIQHVQSICDNLEVPYFELRPAVNSLGPAHNNGQRNGRVRRQANGFVPTATATEAAEGNIEIGEQTNNNDKLGQHLHIQRQFQQQPANKLEDLTMNLHPSAQQLNGAYIDLIYALNWTSFAIVYEHGSSMIKLQDLFKESSTTWINKWKIKLFRYDHILMDSPFLPVSLVSQPNQADGLLDSSRSQSAMPSSNHYDSNGNRANYNIEQLHTNGLEIITSSHHQQQQQQQQTQPTKDKSGYVKATNDNKNSWNYLPFINYNNDASAESTSSPMISNEFNRKSKFNHLLKNNNKFSDSKQTKLLAPKLHINHNKNQKTLPKFRDVFWKVKSSGEKNIILDIKTENLYEALKQAQQVGLMTEDYSFLITSLDLHMIDLEDFKYSRTKISSFSILQVPKSPIKEDDIQSDESLIKKHEILDYKTNNSASIQFDERYLESLGVHVIQMNTNDDFKSSDLNLARKSSNNFKDLHKLELNQMRQRSTTDNILSQGDNFMSSTSLDPMEKYQLDSTQTDQDQAKKEMLQSLPASLSLLPTLDRNNEQKLFEFFVEQQDKNMSHIRLSTTSAILHDSLMLYLLGLYELDPDGLLLSQTQNVACTLGSNKWSHGSSLVNYMRQLSFNGLTGPVNFDGRGFRSYAKLDFMGLAPNTRPIKIGEWYKDETYLPIKRNDSNNFEQMDTSNNGNNDEIINNTDVDINVATSAPNSYDDLSIHYARELKRYTQLLSKGEKIFVPYKKVISKQAGSLLVNEILFHRIYREQADQIDTLVVTAKLSQPYFMLKETPNKLEGNDQFEGYAVDLIHELSKLVNFNYKWRVVGDNKYGSKEVLPNGTVVWNGMIGEIVSGQADLAIVDLTITAQREEAVDFTLPFMNTGISILFKKPTTKVTTLFSFLSPFSSDVWAYVLAAYCGISAILYFVGHLSPYEWTDPHPCRHSNNDDNTVLKNQFSLLNSFWFTIGSLMQQGSDLTPRSMSTRTIAGIWYFFTLIMISSYTANLAAFLTVEKVVYPIENVRDLSNQQEIRYGCIEFGSTCLFFQDSQIDTYKRIAETMKKYRTYVRSNDEGQKRVGEGKFAFFMESTTIEYIIERNCNLTQIGGLIDSKGYGLATSKKSRLKRPYRTLLNEGILHLQETGMLHVLKNRWWKERRGGGTCSDDGKGSGVTELSLANVGGVFVVLLGGLGISFLVAIVEFMWRARRGGSSRDRMCEEMMNDLKFALACKSSTKPIYMVNRNRSIRR